MSLFYRKNTRPLFALLLSLAPFFAGIAISSALNNENNSSLYFSVGICLSVFQCAAYLFVLHISSKRFVVYFLICGFLILFGQISVGFLFDKSFFKVAFITLGQLYILSLYRSKDIYKESPSKDITRFLILTTSLWIIAAMIWMLMLGYNIIFRKMPGASYWMLFNLNSAFNILIGIDALLVLFQSLHTRFSISDNKVAINGIDYTPLLSKNDRDILMLFAKEKSHRINCSAILQKQTDGMSDENREICASCIETRQKATLCKHYKRIYNQINKIKKFLETMRVGTILSSQNKMDITKDGWTLHVFENVRFSLEK